MKAQIVYNLCRIKTEIGGAHSTHKRMRGAYRFFRGETCFVLRFHKTVLCILYTVGLHVMGLHFIGLYFVGLHITDQQPDRYTFMFTCPPHISGPHFTVINITVLQFISLPVSSQVVSLRVIRPRILSLQIKFLHIVAMHIIRRHIAFYSVSCCRPACCISGCYRIAYFLCMLLTYMGILFPHVLD